MQKGVVRATKSKDKRNGLKPSLGKFINFPITTHGFAKMTYSENLFQVQPLIVQALQELNSVKRTYPIFLPKEAKKYKGKIGFEVGIAEGIYFNYLNSEMTEKLSKSITPRKVYHNLDFIIIVTYHYNRRGKNVPLNFDYHQLRLIFNNGKIEMRLFHSKGTRRMAFDELFNTILRQINKKMNKKSMNSLILEELKVL
ncbi:MAG: hypothetical protein V1915_04400 [Candidatus Bathyarchaeota archaeon]